MNNIVITHVLTGPISGTFNSSHEQMVLVPAEDNLSQSIPNDILMLLDQVVASSSTANANEPATVESVLELHDCLQLTSLDSVHIYSLLRNKHNSEN